MRAAIPGAISGTGSAAAIRYSWAAPAISVEAIAPEVTAQQAVTAGVAMAEGAATVAEVAIEDAGRAAFLIYLDLPQRRFLRFIPV
jgi:hypothetical protein